MENEMDQGFMEFLQAMGAMVVMVQVVEFNDLGQPIGIVIQEGSQPWRTYRRMVGPGLEFAACLN